MTLENVFSICSTLAMFSWIALFVFYPRKWIYKLLFSGVLILFALTYLYLISLGLSSESEGGFGSLAEVAALFQKEEALLAGWIHYLAFDLFVGMWITQDADRKGFSRWLILPCLIFTFMLGPVGLLIYIIIRMIKFKQMIQHPFSNETNPGSILQK